MLGLCPYLGRTTQRFGELECLTGKTPAPPPRLDHLVAHLSVASHVGHLEFPALLATVLLWRHGSTGHVWLLGTSMPAQKCWRSGSVGLPRVFGSTESSCPARAIKPSFEKQMAKTPTHSDPGV